MAKSLLNCILFFAAFFLAYFTIGNLLETRMGSVDSGYAIRAETEQKNVNYVRVDNNKQASTIAGYQVKIPTYLPEIFNDNSKCIHIVRFKNINSVPVIQMWSAQDGTQLYLISDPEAKGIAGGGDFFEIAGVHGERAYYGKEIGREVPLLVLFWFNDTTTYTLCGTLSNSLDEATMIKIAESIITDG